MPIIKPNITPIFPNLLNMPAIIPEIAYDAIIIGSLLPIIPKTTPIVIPEVAPTNIPFFQPKINTSNILNMFFTLYPNTAVSPNAINAMAKSKLVPITSSMENTFFIPTSLITVIEFENIL